MRRQSVAFCLIDVGFLSDPKFRRLARRLPDPDDLNSAIGAWLVGLAASRRNGSHQLDMAAETDSRFVPDLQAVGLLDGDGFPLPSWKEWDAMSPQQAAAGRQRARDAGRDAGGRFTSGTSFTSALASMVQPVQPSPPLPSKRRGGVGGKPPTARCGACGKQTPVAFRRGDYVLCEACAGIFGEASS